jgi:hypothetical protein
MLRRIFFHSSSCFVFLSAKIPEIFERLLFLCDLSNVIIVDVQAFHVVMHRTQSSMMQWQSCGPFVLRITFSGLVSVVIAVKMKEIEMV